MNDIAIPHTLKDRLKNRRVIPFVGAGVSMAVLDGSTNGPLFPSWKVLLEEAADRLEKEIKDAEANLVRGFLGKVPADYLEAARYAREGLSGS